MYDQRDPRSTLQTAAPASKAATDYHGAEYGRFYQDPPQIVRNGEKTWITRGQAFIIAYTEAEAGVVLVRDAQEDEYVVLAPDSGVSLEVTCTSGTHRMEGNSIGFAPPGRSEIKFLTRGSIIRMFSPKAADLTQQSSNAAAYASPDPNVAPFKAWPAPPDGFRFRQYSLDVPNEPGRFGRIFRCTTFMVNFLEPRVGLRDRKMVSPHHHDDFEQCSLALEGSFIHHLRWPWTTDMNVWREDEHAVCGSPSIIVIPPPAIHTTTSEDPGVNQLVDIFAPPRMDFSSKPGWVLNEKDYPMP